MLDFANRLWYDFQGISKSIAISIFIKRIYFFDMDSLLPVVLSAVHPRAKPKAKRDFER